ncbi:uncharacterized protein FIBRA_08299 [Fibroporia radiculosa]|uniref:Glucose-methanol-choline oxidoreductase N-terminal domain-containing protein n=1 Tax=Fibroporia radiculosa TaxID=599839 RepID=J4I2I0_9APHY|nr:uncharacterized protein FIBRA_08299 [Fibroporia radiculosa]CCM06052.1 predicted protein [Fibroporia radiculosa]
MQRWWLLLMSLAAVVYSVVECAIYSDPAQLSQIEYDFVIVGAGIGGNVLAARISEISDFSVLVIEAGIKNEDFVDDKIPFLCSTLSPDTALTWNYTTTPQIGLNNRTIPYQRGRVLGGSSTINYMIWNRGSVDDWNRYAEYTGDSGWSWDEIFPYMLKSETLVPPSDHHDTAGEVNPALHGTSGPVQISLGGYPTSIDRRVLDTTRELHLEFPYNDDMNSGYPLGVGWNPNSVDTFGRRSSSATSYLELAYGRPNLDVLIQTQVTKLISSPAVDGTLTFTEVEVTQTADSPTYTVQAAKEVILAAGSIGTPQILLLSGIGDSATLESIGIAPLVNLSDVGQHLVDHPLLSNQWLVNSTDTFQAVTRNVTYETELFFEWNSTGTGLFVDPGSIQLGWGRLSSNSTVYGLYTDPSAGPASPQMEWLFANGFVSSVQPIPATGNYLSIATTVVSPASRGSVVLASKDPFEDPLIDPGLLSSPFDLAVMAQAVKHAQTFVTATAWDDYIIAPAGGLAGVQTDADLEMYIRNFTATIWHPVGTARMQPVSGEGSVVTSDLLVKGTSGLRIVDASVLPYIPSMHPQAVVYALAERAADLVKAAWSRE